MRTIITLFIGMLLGIILLGVSLKQDGYCKVDLPEEYKLIDEHSLLTGSFDKDSTLVIRFYQTPDDVVEFQWDADEKDIPFEIGSHINVSGSDGNIIYLTPIDE